MKSIGHLVKPAAALLGLALILGGNVRAQDQAAQPAASGNVIQSVDVSAQGGAVTIRLGLKEPPAAPPAAFTVNNPPRIALDFPDTANGLGKNTQDVNQGELRNIRLGQSGGRTRVVLNLSRMTKYESRTEGNDVIITLHGARWPNPKAPLPSFPMRRLPRTPMQSVTWIFVAGRMAKPRSS
jgi:type IV pilus assembly protein PilQ